MIEKDKVD